MTGPRHVEILSDASSLMVGREALLADAPHAEGSSCQNKLYIFIFIFCFMKM